MRLLVTIATVVGFALATMVVHVGNAIAMESMTGTSVMAEMNMGLADTPACPPEICAKMKT